MVEVPCYDTLVKHKRGKEHIKREKDLEACFQTINLGINWHPSQERRKKDGLGDHAWAESKKPVGHYKGFEASCEILQVVKFPVFLLFSLYLEKNLNQLQQRF